MKKLNAAILASSALLLNSISFANPKGGQVTAGQITITEGAGVTTINQTDTRGIIHWQDFSIGAGELTQFVQPSSSAAILNRVVGGVPSGIHGTLSANGHIYLINPNGILVGPTGVINTAGFVASTLDVPDAEFMAGGNMRFSGNSLAGVVNLGVITATEGDVILMGRSVENAGTINAPNGVVALAAGSDILMQAAGDERVVVNAGVAGGGNGVTNSGAINAAQAELKAAGGNVYALAVNNTGVIKATGIAQKNGRVILSASGGVVQNSGQISATSVTATPGEVRMDSGALGQTINSGTVDAAKIALTSAGGIVQNTGSVGGTSTTGTPAEVIMDSGAGGQTLNSGTVQSSNISLLSNGGLVNNAGMIAARNADGSGGHITLNAGPGGVVINGGIVDASSGSDTRDGGVVEVLGGTITLTSTSQIKASGKSGGTVAVGISAEQAAKTTPSGGVAALAADPEAKAAQKTAIEAGSRILANATNAGNGGRIVVWSEQQTKVGGVIEAKGGSTSGDGGLVETSGKLGLTITPGTIVLTSSPKGKGGTWLLDPAGITVTNGVAGSSDTTNHPNSPFNQNANMNSVAAADIITALSSGNVTVTTSNAFAPNTDIVVNSAIAIPIALGGAHTLSLTSAGGIDINASIGGAGSDVILQMQSHGNININVGGSVQMNGVSIFAISGDLSIADSITALNNKNIFLNAPAGSIAFSGNGKANASTTATVFLDTHLNDLGTLTSASTAAVSAGNLDIWSGPKGVGTSANPFVVSVDNLQATVNVNTATSGGGVFIKNTSGGTLHIGGTNTLTLQPAAGILVPNLVGFGGVEITNTAGNIRLDAAATNARVSAPGNIKLIANGLNSDIQLFNPGNSSTASVFSHNGSVTLTAGRDVLIGDVGSSVANVSVIGHTDTIVQAGGDVIVAGSTLKAGGNSGLTVTAGGDINIVTGSGSFGLIGTSGGASINLTTGSGKTLNSNSNFLGGVSGTLFVDLTGSGAAAGADIFIKADKVTINSPINAGTGNVTITPVTASLDVDLGTKNAAKLSLTSAEIGQIHADTVFIGSDTGSGGLVVSDFISNPSFIKNLELDAGGNINTNKPVFLPNGSLALVTANGAITSTALLGAKDVSFKANGPGPIDVSLGNVVANTLEFNTQGNVVLTNPLNNILAINVSSATQVNLNTIGDLTINGQLGIGGGFTSYIKLQTGGNLTLSAGVSIRADNIDLSLSNGTLFNNAGSSALAAGSRYRVWEANVFTAQNSKGGLAGIDFLTATVLPPSDPAGAGNVFYYASLTPPASVVAANNGTQASAGGANTGAKTFRLFSAPTLTPEQTKAEFKRYLATLSLQELVALTADPNVMNDPDKKNILLSQVNVLNTYAREPLSLDEQAAIVAEAAKAIQIREDAIRTQKLTVLKAKLAPMSFDMNDPYISGAFTGGSIHALLARVNLGSFSVDQLTLLSREQILAMLGSAGVELSPSDRKAALSATMTQDQLSAIIRSGDGLTERQFASVIAAGAGNLTFNQIIAAGAGNLIGQDGAGLIGQDGAGLVLRDRNGKVVSNDGGSLTIFQIASVISNDGGNLVTRDGVKLIGQDGAGLIGQDGAGLIGQDGAGLIGQDGAGLLKAVASLIGQDGAGILAGNSRLIGQDGAGLIGQDGAGFARKIAVGLIGDGGSTLINRTGTGLIGDGGNTLKPANGAGAIQFQGAATVNPVMKP